jgi:inhibitor of cysteine peptidase
MKKSNTSVTKEIVNAKKVATRAKLKELIQARGYFFSGVDDIINLPFDPLINGWITSTSSSKGISTSGSTYSTGSVLSSTTNASNSVFTSSRANMITTSNMVLDSNLLDIQTNDFVGTNEQVKNVHEGDLVKTDGKRIFYIPSNSKVLHVIHVTEKKASLFKSIKLEFHVTDMYITDSKVVLIGSNYQNAIGMRSFYTYDSHDNSGIVEVRDIETMEKTYSIKTENELSSHRVIKDSLFIVTHKEPDVDNDQELRPIIYENEKKLFVPYSNMFYFTEDPQSELSVLLSISLNNNKSSSIAFVGSFHKNIYMNEDSLFMVSKEYHREKERTISRIIKFDVDYDNASLTYCATGTIDGTILNQYAMDEFNGMFRVVTTFDGWFRDQDKSRNRLFILKEDEEKDTLKYLTSIENGIGKRGETVKSARFSGNLVYITTFMKTDPIYTIDLTDIYYPIFKSEISEDGYSTYMHEWGKNHLIGIGYSASSTGRIDGIKVSAYKTDGSKNVPVDSIAFKGDNGWNSYTSEVIDNPKSLLIYSEKGILGFPLTNRQYGRGTQELENVFMILSVDFDREKVLKKEAGINHGTTHIDRGIYIDGIIYTLSQDELVSYDFDNKDIKDIISLRQKEMTRLVKF